MFAGVPECPSSTTVTPIDTNPLYPDPKDPPGKSVVIPLIAPAETVAVTDAPTRGANPSPGVDPSETIIPPLGVSFWFTSISETIYSNGSLSGTVIPENVMVLIPASVSSIISKLPLGLLEVVGCWKMPLIRTIPLPPMVPIPVVSAPPTCKVNVLPIPLNSLDRSSYILFVV